MLEPSFTPRIFKTIDDPKARIDDGRPQSRHHRLLSCASLNLSNAWLSCGARAPQCVRPGPPARRQLQPVVRK